MVSSNTLYYYHSTIPQIFATLVGLFTLFIILVHSEIKKGFLIDAKKLLIKIKDRSGNYKLKEGDKETEKSYEDLKSKLSVLIELEDTNEIEELLEALKKTDINKTEEDGCASSVITNTIEVFFNTLDENFWISIDDYLILTTRAKIVLTFGTSIFVIIWSLISIILTDFIKDSFAISLTTILVSLIFSITNLLMYFQLSKEQINNFKLVEKKGSIFYNDGVFNVFRIIKIGYAQVLEFFKNLFQKKKGE